MTIMSRDEAGAEMYRIHVHGHLDDHWSDWLGGFAIQQQDDGTTVLIGPIVDQAALHGVLTRIRDLGLSLLSVSQAIEPSGRTSRDVCWGGAIPT